MTQLRQVIHDIFQECSVSLFNAYGVKISAQEIKPVLSVEEVDLIGVIGFFSRKVRGNIAINVASRILENTGRNRESRDWLSELANQLAGRVTNRLRHFDIDADMNTPVVLQASALATLLFKNPHAERFSFADPDGRQVNILLDGEYDPRMEVFELEGREELIVEGQALVF